MFPSPLLAALLAAAAPATPSPSAPAPARSPAPVADAAVAPPPSLGEADLAPLFPSGPLAKAVADLDAGRPADAAKALRTSPLPPARYLAAAALLQTGAHAEALPLLDGLEQQLPDLADRILFRRGQALDALGRRREAAAAWDGVAADSTVWVQARLAAGRALDGAGDRAAALAALAPLLGELGGAAARGAATPEALLLAGRLHADGGDGAAARRALLACWADHPLSAAAGDCLRALRALPAPHGAAPALADGVRRADALLDENRNRAAIVELEKVVAKLGPPSPSNPLACRGRFALGKAWRKERQHTRAMGELVRVVDRCDDPVLRPRALYVLASSASIASPPDGVVRYEQLAREYPAHPFADDALFYAADLLQRAGRPQDARATLAELASRFPQGDFRAEALFRGAWLAEQQGDRDAALAGLAALEREYARDAYEHARAAYWRARWLAGGGPADVAAAYATWSQIASRYPADWYGLLAAARLAEAGEPLPPRASAAPAPDAATGYRAPALLRDRHFRAGLLLFRMGQRGAAVDELAAVDRRLLTGDAEGLDAVLLVADLLDRAGDHRRAHNLVRTAARAALRGAPEPATLRAWRIAYPPAFRAEIERHARSAGVDPDLLQALVREESALDPRVVSGAGAVGLTQLMPTTAQHVAKRLKLRKPTVDDLMEPSLNLRLGAAYLGELLQRAGGSAPLAVAAYNVGEAPVRRWTRERGDLPLDAFVEEIPVSETRGYVKRVLRTWAAYRTLYGAADAGPPLFGASFPRLAGP
jgi:soluble lytic murein transglycosylase